MNPDQPSREQIEARITALLLGELPPDEAALLRYTIAQDPALQKLHDELRATLVLVREAEKSAVNAPATPLKLSAARRQKLLAHFKTPRPKPVIPLFWLRPIGPLPLIPVLAAIAVMVVLAAMLLPVLSTSKHTAQRAVTDLKNAPLSGRIWSSRSDSAAPMTPPPSSTEAFLAVTNGLPPGTVVTASLSGDSPAPAHFSQTEIVLPGDKSTAGVPPGSPAVTPPVAPPASGLALGQSRVGPVDEISVQAPPPISASGHFNLNSGRFAGVTSDGAESAYNAPPAASPVTNATPPMEMLPQPVTEALASEPVPTGPAKTPGRSGSRFSMSGPLNNEAPSSPTAPAAHGASASNSSEEILVTKSTRLARESTGANRSGADRRSARFAFISPATLDSPHLDDASGSMVAAGGEAGQNQADTKNSQAYHGAQRELQQMLKNHELLYSKVEAERLDLSLPKDATVQIIDPAAPGKSRNAWQRLTGQVESKVRLKVGSDETDVPGFGGSSPTSSYDPYFVQTTFEIIQSDAVLSNVVRSLDLQSAWGQKNGGEKLTEKEAVARLRNQLDLRPVPNTKVIEIGVTSDNPDEAATLANAVAGEYLKYRNTIRQQMTTNGLAVLEAEFRQQEADIKQTTERVAELKKAAAAPVANQTDAPLAHLVSRAPIPQPEILTRTNALSTFALNVSDVSFKFAQASLQNGKLPDPASIRSEEFINAFDYRDPEAPAGQPMAFAAERARYPFAHNREVLRLAVKAAAAGRPAGRPLNLVLLLDKSGSMERADRVAIVREALRVLAIQLQPPDTVSVVTFARTARLWADGISGSAAGATLDRVGGITPEGGTNLEEAMRLAYETARRHYRADGINRVVLLTDGAANLGDVDPQALKTKVDAQRKQGIALDCFGIGWEDYNDNLLELLSSNGDGRYAFLNSPDDATKEFAAKLAGALQIAAADLKVQVEFNPARVIAYRQIGYATHQLTPEQFRDNTVAAGEIAAREAGNALYTIETDPGGDGSIATIRVRYRVPGTSDYREHTWDVPYEGPAPALDQADPALRLAATAAAFSEWLAGNPYAQTVTPDELLRQLSGIPEIYGADDRPKQLETMIREAKSLEGK